MAQEILDLVAEVRSGSGKGAARQARRDGKVPGVVYGDNKEPVSININYYYLLKRLKAGRFLSKIHNLKIEGGEEVQVVCRNVQRDVVKDLPTHIDFLRVGADTRIKLFVPVQFVNQDAAPGIQKGGKLAVVSADVLLEVVASAIPEAIVVDLTGKNIGDAVMLSDIELPAGVVSGIDRDVELGNVYAPSGLLITE